MSKGAAKADKKAGGRRNSLTDAEVAGD